MVSSHGIQCNARYQDFLYWNAGDSVITVNEESGTAIVKFKLFRIAPALYDFFSTIVTIRTHMMTTMNLSTTRFY